MAESFVIYPGVQLGLGSTVGEFALVGVLLRGRKPGEVETRIGDGATIRSHAVIYAGNVIGNNFQTGHGVMIREFNEIGNDVSIGTHSVVEHHVKLGNGVRVHSNAFIPEFSIIEDGAWIGPNVVFTNALYPLSPNAKATLKGPHIMEGAKIGANATLLPGVVVGRNAIVGAGSVVVKDVAAGKVVVGNPARVIKDVSEISAYELSKLIKEATNK